MLCLYTMEELLEKYEHFEIRLSVRELVEFMFRSGDIDNRRGTSPERAMQEGSRLHRMIQKSMGAGYEAEVPLRYSYVGEHCTIFLDGRADGIINESIAVEAQNRISGNQLSFNQYYTNEEYPQITIDEIKCVARRLDRISSPLPVHLAQAKVYAFIYAKQKELPSIRIRMTYCNIETEDLKYFIDEFSFAQIEEWFGRLMQDYMKWAERQREWLIQRQSSIQSLEFPFVYRKGQRELAAQVYRTVREGRKLFLEAPTGVGKTLTTLFPAVKSMGADLTEKVFYLTAKTITRSVAGDAIGLLRQKGLKIKSVVITAKEKVCLNDKCECNPDICPYAKGHYDRINDAVFHSIMTYDNLDRETITLTARQYQVCPFELSLDLSLLCDILICDYNYVFDPHVSLKRYFADGVHGDYVFLVDEAHNLVDRGRDMYSAVLKKEDFLAVKRQINAASEQLSGKKTKRVRGMQHVPAMIRGLERCNRDLLQLKRECSGFRVLEEIDAFAGQVQGLYTAMTKFMDEEENTGMREPLLEFYFALAHFLLIYEKLDENYRIYTEQTENSGFCLKLLCVNPAKNLSECMEKGRAGVLFSATLLPISYYKKLLGAAPEDAAVYAESSFDRERLGVFVGRDVTSRYKRRNEDTYYRIASYIDRAISGREGKYLIFFPSYLFMNNVIDSFQRHFHKEDRDEMLIQQERMSEEDREAFLARFTRKELIPMDNLFKTMSITPPTLLGFCVLGGIFSEGIDLKEDALIGSIIVGVGFPQICNEREIIRDYFEENGFDYAYRFPGMNKVLQAAGRVIRTERDKGVVLLLDERFTDNSYQRMFPREWKGYTVTGLSGIADGLESFWEKD